MRRTTTTRSTRSTRSARRNPSYLERALAGDKNLKGADLRRADLGEANLSGANLEGAKLLLVNLKEADLEGANLERANLMGANLMGANLRYADLEDANLTGADLSGAHLRDANLAGSDLSGANLWGANLQGANLAGAYLSGAKLKDVYLYDANLTRANLQYADLRGAILTDANLKGAILMRANLKDANLGGANLEDANVQGANLMGANLMGANLRYANLEDANLTGADLTNANLTSADLEDAVLEGANLERANLEGANLEGANLEGTILTMPPVTRPSRSFGRQTGAVLKMGKPDAPAKAADFKRRYPAEAERLKGDTQGRDFSEPIRATVRKKYATPFEWLVTEGTYDSATQRLCPDPNLVYKFNLDLDQPSFTDRQRAFLTRLAETSRRSGHPYEKKNLFTVGWVRLCVNDAAETWLVEEIQSDVGIVRTKLKDGSAPAGLEGYEDVIVELRPYIDRFYEDALGIVFMEAEKKGYGVEMLEYEAKKAFKSPRGIYTDLPKSMGMQKRPESVVLGEGEVAETWFYKPNPARKRSR